MNAVSRVRQFPSDWSRVVYQGAFACPNCHRLSIATKTPDEYTKDVLPNYDDGDTFNWGDSITWLPKRGQQRDFPDVPPKIAEAATEATFCLSVGAYRATGSLARAVIEATAKEKKAEGKDLYHRIEALAAGGHIREHTKEQAHEIRHFGNGMAHGDFTDPVTEEDAAEVVELMSEVLNEVFQSPARLAKVKEAREAKKAAAKAANGGP